MQKNTRQSIRDFVERGKRRRIWKRITAVLSAVVLVSTAVGLHDIAIAVTNEQAEKAALQDVVAAALAQEQPAPEEVVPLISATEMTSLEAVEEDGSGTPSPSSIEEATDTLSGAGVPDPVADLEAIEEDGSGTPSPSSIEETTDTSNGEAVPDPLTGDIPLDIPDPVADPEPVEGPETADTLTITDAPVALSALAAPLANRTEAANIDSARPTSLRVLDLNGNPLSRTAVGEAAVVELKWEIDDLSEIQVGGDYNDITLPSELDFPEGRGYFVLNQRYDMPNGEILWPGQNVAIYTIQGNNLHIEYTLTAVYLNQIGKLLPGLNVGSKEWLTLRVEGVTVKEAGTIQPAITLNGKSVSTPQTITVLERTGGRMEGVKLTSMKVLDGMGEPLTELPRTFSTITLEIKWERSAASPYLAAGDFYEIELPEQLEYNSFDRTVTDSSGNIVRMVLSKNGSGKWILKATYEQVFSGYNVLEGTATVSARIPDIFNYQSNGTNTTYLTAKVVDGDSSITVPLEFQGIALPVISYGAPYWAPYWPDYILPESIFYMAVGGVYGSMKQAEFSLYVMADASKVPKYDYTKIRPYPYNDPSTVVSYDPDANGNWWAAFCLDQSNPNIPNSGAAGPYDYYMFAIADAQKYISGNSGATTSYFTASEQQYVNSILSTAYPFISLEEMAANLGESSITTEEAIAAAQYALWCHVGTNLIGSFRNRTYLAGNGDVNKVKRIAEKMSNYRGAQVGDPGYSFAFTEEPKLTYGTDDRGYGSVQVNGKVGTTNPNVLNNLKATFEAGGLSSPITFRDDGSFTCTLVGTAQNPISQYTTPASISIDGDYKFVETYVFFNYDGKQPAVSARVVKRPVHLEWEYKPLGERKLKVIKEWQDENGNVLQAYPDAEVTVNILRNGVLYKTVTLNKANHFTYEETLTERYDANGIPYEYTIEEVGKVDGYEFVGVDGSAEDGGMTIIFTAVNRKEEKKTLVRIIKDWKGVPDSKRNGFKAYVGLFFQVKKDWNRNDNHGNGWKNQVLIKDATERTEAGALVINGTYYLDTKNFPTSERDGYRYAVAELTADNNWTVVFDGLPKYDEDGDPVQYLIRELRVEDADGEDVTEDFAVTYEPGLSDYPFGDGNYYVFVNMEEDIPTAKVTNMKRGSLTVEKKWVNADGTEDWSEIVPNGIEVTLHAKRGDKEISSDQLAQLLEAPVTVTLNAANNWSHTWNYIYIKGMTYYISEVITTRQGNAYYYVRLDENGNTVEIKSNAADVTEDDWVKVEYDSEKNVFYLLLTNQRRSVEIELVKEDKDSGAKLQGAAFMLYDENGQEVPNPAEKDGLYRTDENGVVKVGSTDGVHLMISQIAKGRAEGDAAKYLHKYVLVEKDPPEGYIKRNNPMSITFHIEIISGHPAIVIDDLDAQTKEENLVTTARNDSGKLLLLHIKNEKATYSLPETGGVGTNGYMTGGLLLMALAFLFYISKHSHMKGRNV